MLIFILLLCLFKVFHLKNLLLFNKLIINIGCQIIKILISCTEYLLVFFDIWILCFLGWPLLGIFLDILDWGLKHLDAILYHADDLLGVDAVKVLALGAAALALGDDAGGARGQLADAGALTRALSAAF